MKKSEIKKARTNVESETTNLSEQASLSPQRAFVVHFRSDTNVERRLFAGRVEQVVSGRAVHFSSLAELLAFVARALKESRRERQTDVTKNDQKALRRNEK